MIRNAKCAHLGGHDSHSSSGARIRSEHCILLQSLFAKAYVLASAQVLVLHHASSYVSGGCNWFAGEGEVRYQAGGTKRQGSVLRWCIRLSQWDAIGSQANVRCNKPEAIHNVCTCGGIWERLIIVGGKGRRAAQKTYGSQGSTVRTGC